MITRSGEYEQRCEMEVIYSVFLLFIRPWSSTLSLSLSLSLSLGTVISPNHHLYADDTQLLISFSVLDFSHNITQLENTN